MIKKVYVINGSGGVGKDTFCSLVNKYVNSVVISSITPIKNIAERVGWSGTKTEKDRKFLSDLKDLFTEYNDYPMQYLKSQCIPFLRGEMYIGCKVMFLHIREPKEIQRAVEAFGAKTILITNANVEHIESNHADKDVSNYTYDCYIHNDGSLEQLNELAKSFCEVEGLL